MGLRPIFAALAAAGALGGTALAQAPLPRCGSADYDHESCGPCTLPGTTAASPGGAPARTLRFVLSGGADPQPEAVEIAIDAGAPALQRFALAPGDKVGCRITVEDMNHDGRPDFAVETKYAMRASQLDYFLSALDGGFVHAGNHPTMERQDEFGRYGLTVPIIMSRPDWHVTWRYLAFGTALIRLSVYSQTDDDASDWLTGVIRTGPDGRDAEAERFRVFGDSERDRAAMGVWRERVDAALGYARELAGKGDDKGAAEHLGIAMSWTLLPPDAETPWAAAPMSEFGHYLARSGRYALAAHVLGLVTDATPEHAEAWLRRGDAEYGEALPHGEAVARLAARGSYLKYRALLEKAGTSGDMPPRIAERLR